MKAWSLLVIVSSVALFAAACGGTSAPGSPAAAASSAPTGSSAPPTSVQASAASPALQAIIDGAKKEGEIDLVWPTALIGANVQPYIDAFNKTYGLNTSVKFTPGPSMPVLAAKLIQEVQTGRTPETDIYLGASDPFAPMVKANAAAETDWSWAPNLTPKLVAPKGVGVIVQDGVDGITYNTNAVKGALVPKTLQDLLKPQFKGRLASTSYAAGFPYLASPDMWGEQRTFDYLTKFSAQVSGLMRCSETDRVASGEFDAFAIDCGLTDSLSTVAKGAPMQIIVPTDAATIDYFYAAIPKGAAHPNTAKLLINFLDSRAGQDLMYKYSLSDTHLIPGSHAAKYLATVQASGAKIEEIDLQWVLNQGDKISTWQKRAQQILQAGAKKK